jgi:hypothetical protein
VSTTNPAYHAFHQRSAERVPRSRRASMKARRRETSTSEVSHPGGRPGPAADGAAPVAGDAGAEPSRTGSASAGALPKLAAAAITTRAAWRRVRDARFKVSPLYADPNVPVDGDRRERISRM